MVILIYAYVDSWCNDRMKKFILALALIPVLATASQEGFMQVMQRQRAADKKELKALKEKIFNGTATLKDYFRSAGIILRHI